MDKTYTIVIATDDRYFELAKGLILSIRDKPEGADAPISFLDFGCTDEQRAWLADYIQATVVPELFIDFPTRQDEPEGLLKMMAVKPYLPRYFPGFETYLWIDADTWVQDWRAVELYLRAAEMGMALTPEIDRSYTYFYDHGHARRWMYGCYNRAYGPKVAKLLHLNPILNAGVYALKRGAPQWDVWAKQLRVAARKTTFAVDQTALNFAVYTKRFPVHFLPSWCNWITSYSIPVLDEASGRLCEPYLPYRPLGIIHLTHPKAKFEPIEVRTGSGKKRRMLIRYREGDY